MPARNGMSLTGEWVHMRMQRSHKGLGALFRIERWLRIRSGLSRMWRQGSHHTVLSYLADGNLPSLHLDTKGEHRLSFIIASGNINLLRFTDRIALHART